MDVQLFIVTVADQGTGHLWVGSVCQQQDPALVTLVPSTCKGLALRTSGGILGLVFCVVLSEITEVL